MKEVPNVAAPGRTAADVSVVVPTYRRGTALLDTLGQLLDLEPPPGEILVVDQTEAHPAAVAEQLRGLEAAGRIRILRFSPPSIPRASPETTTKPASPRPRPMRSAILWPIREALRDPTIAAVGRPNSSGDPPRMVTSGGGAAIWRR